MELKDGSRGNRGRFERVRQYLEELERDLLSSGLAVEADLFQVPADPEFRVIDFPHPDVDMRRYASSPPILYKEGEMRLVRYRLLEGYGPLDDQPLDSD